MPFRRADAFDADADDYEAPLMATPSIIIMFHAELMPRHYA